jgi:hypothetical protein
MPRMNSIYLQTFQFLDTGIRCSRFRGLTIFLLSILVMIQLIYLPIPSKEVHL